MYGDDPQGVRAHAHHVRGRIEQLQKDAALPAAARQKAGGICTQSEKIRSLIGNLNLTSKLQYGAQPLHCAPLAVGPFLRRCAAEFYESNGKAEICFLFELTSESGKSELFYLTALCENFRYADV